MDHLDTAGQVLEVGDYVEFIYRGGKQTGYIHEFTGRQKTRVGIHPDSKWYSTNSGSASNGKKSNSIELNLVTKLEKPKGQSVEPTAPGASEPIVAQDIEVGSAVIIKSKDDLVTELGADDAGYPLTTTRFNHSGNMDHYFGATGVVTALNSERGYIEMDFNDKEAGLSYDWAISTDMVAIDDGSYIGVSTPREPLRAFLKTNEDPTPRQVWTALLTLKKKLNLNDGVVLNLIGLFASKGITQLRRVIEFTEETSFKATLLPSNIEKYELIYPKVNTELLALAYRLMEGVYGRGPNTQYDVIDALVKELVELKINSDLAIEFGDIPFTPMKRALVASTQDMIDSVWGNLNIHESYLEKGYHPSVESMVVNIADAIKAYLNEHGKLHLTDGDIIEIGA